MTIGKSTDYRENATQFLAIGSHRDLADHLGITLTHLEELINRPSYTEFRIKKRQYGERLIQEPSFLLKVALKRLNYYLNAVYLTEPNEHVYGFIPRIDYELSDKNIVGNARQHLGRNHLYNIDIKDFFPSISTRRVYQVFTGSPFHFNEEIAIALSLLTTYRKSLPTGANTSPILSNFVCREMDAEIARLAIMSEMLYTRYADDLTFSSDLPFTPKLKKDIKEIIERHGFRINERKSKDQSRHRRQVVTGIKVNEKLNVDRTYIRNLRALLHDWKINGFEEAVRHHYHLHDPPTCNQILKFENFLNGKMSYLRFVRGRGDGIYLDLKKKLRELQNE